MNPISKSWGFLFDLFLQFCYIFVVKKIKIYDKKIIKVKPRMEKDSTSIEMLIVIIIGILFGMVLISIF